MPADFTSKFKVDISDLKQNIAEAQRQIKTANATFKAETAGMDKWSNDATGLAKKLDQLKSVLEGQKTILSAYQQQMERQQSAYNENGKRADELRQKLQQLASEGVDKTSAEYRVLESELTKVEQEQRNNGKAIDQLKDKILAQQTAVAQTEKEIRNYTDAQKKLEDESKSATKALADHEKALKELKAKYVDVVATEGKNSASAKALEGQIKELSKQVQSEKVALQNASVEADKLDKSTQNLDKDSKGATDTLKNLASSLTGGIITAVGSFAAAVTGAVTALAGMSVSAAQFADDVITISAVTGMSTDKVQELKYMAQLTDVSLETISGAMTKTTKGMEAAAKGTATYADAFKKLGVEIKDSEGKLRDNEDVFYESIAALGKIEDETERDALAMTLFGKSAQTLNPIIKRSADELQAFADEAHEMGYVLDEDTLNSLGNFDDGIQRLKNGATALKNTFGTMLLYELQEFVDTGTGLLGDFTRELQEAGRDWDQVGEVVGKYVAKLGDVIAEKLPHIVELGTQIVIGLANAIVNNLPTMVEAAGKIFRTLLDAIPPLVTELLRNLPTIIDTIADFLIDNIPVVLETAIKLLAQIVAAIPEIVTRLVVKIPDIIHAIVSGLVNGATDVFNAALQTFFGIEDAAETSRKNLQETVSKVKEYSDGLLKDTKAQFTDFSNYVDNQGNTLKSVDAEIKDLESKITEYIAQRVKENGELYESDLLQIAEYNRQLKELRAEQLKIYQAQQLADLDMINLLAPSMDQSQAAQLLANAKESRRQALEAVDEQLRAQLADIEQLRMQGAYDTDRQFYNELMAAQEQAEEAKNQIEAYYQESVGTIADASRKWLQEGYEEWGKLQAQTDLWIDSWIGNPELKDVTWIGEMMGAYIQPAKEYTKMLDQIDEETLAAANMFLNMQAISAAAGNDIGDKAKTIAETIIDVFDNLNGEMDDAGKQVLEGLINGMEDSIPALKNAAEMTSDEIVDTIRDALGIEDSGTSAWDRMFEAPERATGTIGEVKRIANGTIGEVRRKTEDEQSGSPAWEKGYLESGTTVVYNQTINAPSSPSRIEIYRDTQNLLNLAAAN